MFLCVRIRDQERGRETEQERRETDRGEEQTEQDVSEVKGANPQLTNHMESRAVHSEY